MRAPQRGDRFARSLSKGNMIARGFIFGAAAIVSAIYAADRPALASSLPLEGSFVYSNLCVERESGDVNGYRVKLLRSAKGDRLYFEWSEGPLYGPALASDLIIDPETSKIAFTIPAHTPPNDLPESERHSGQISTGAIVLDGIFVPRDESDDDRIGPCRSKSLRE